MGEPTDTSHGVVNMFDPAEFSNTNCLAFLDKLNHFDWYVNQGNQIGVRGDGLFRAIAACPNKQQKQSGTLIALSLLGAMQTGQTRIAKIVRLLSLMVAQGPKVFQPTHELCEYFENVDVTLPISDYEQSFPVIVIRLPQTYVQARGLSFQSVACLFEQEHQHLTTLASNLFAIPLDSTTITPNEPSVEHALGDVRYMDGSVAEWNARLDLVRQSERVAINCALFLADRGFRLKHMLNGEQRSRRESRARHTGQRLLPPRELVLTQDVVVDVGVGEPGSTLADNRDSRHQKRVHYRRGHWRMQAYGDQRSLRKRIFIAPILINAHLDSASPSERRVIYHGRNI